MPRWISHRGIDQVVAENSLDSFKNAVGNGFECLETDLRTTHDGVIVLSHDDDLIRVSNQSIKVSSSSFEELKSVRLADGQSLLTFEQFVEIFAGQSWIFDVKPETGDETIHQLSMWAKKRDATDWLSNQARFLFWSSTQERKFKRVFPNVECLARKTQCYVAGISILSGLSYFGQIRPGMTYSLPPNFLGKNLFRSSMAKQYHSRGAKVLAFLPENPTQIDLAVEAGFDEILIDFAIPEKHGGLSADL